ALGDPIEITGLTQAFGADSADRQYCALGSVKSNIGHLEAAAGIAGLTKVLLQMKHGMLAPSLHAQEPNANIDFDSTPFVLQRELAPWKRAVLQEDGVAREYPRIAGVSSFGAGGANAHLIVEEYIPGASCSGAGPVASAPILADSESGTDALGALIVLSAKTGEALGERARQLLDAIVSAEAEGGGVVRSAPPLVLSSVAYTLQVGREGMEHRVGFIVGSLRELQGKLQEYVGGRWPIAGADRGRAQRQKEVLGLLGSD